MRNLPLYLILRGGLGNQLFMFASSLEIAQSSGRNLQLVSHWYRDQDQNSEQPNSVREYELDNFPRIRGINTWVTNLLEPFLYNIFKFTWKFGEKSLLGFCINVDNQNKSSSLLKTFLIFGYMQEPEAYNYKRLNIPDFIRLDEESETKILDDLENIKKTESRLICLHVRRGDRISKNSIQFVLTKNYYMNALQQLNYKSNKVIVFSDDIKWCQENFLGENFTYYLEKSPSLNLRMMTYCDDFIISISTFSWWGAWLADRKEKRVIFPTLLSSENNYSWNTLTQDGWLNAPAEFESS